MKEKIIKILGSGCTSCNMLEQSVRKAVSNMNIDVEIKHIRDFSEIASYGVISTPALVLGDKVLSYGKVLSVDEVEKILKDKF